jgi:hypothetical protein
VTTLARHLLESLGRRRRGAICGRHIAGRLHISFSCQTRPSKLGMSDLRLFSRSEIKLLNRKGVCIINFKRPGSVFVCAVIASGGHKYALMWKFVARGLITAYILSPVPCWWLIIAVLYLVNILETARYTSSVPSRETFRELSETFSCESSITFSSINLRQTGIVAQCFAGCSCMSSLGNAASSPGSMYQTSAPHSLLPASASHLLRDSIQT